MRAHPHGAHRLQGQAGFRQAGFSMVEMLMTAFILAIGILGLSLLQVMSMQASRGSRSLTTAVLLGEAVMDRAEMEGRLSWLNITDTNRATPALTDLSGIRYINIAASGNLTETFTIKGETPNTSATDPADKNTFFTVTTTRTPATAASTGLLSDFSVVVTFTDSVGSTGTPIQRSVRLTRRIAHG